MFCKTYCAHVEGIGARLIQVEVDVSDGLPLFNMVGYLSAEVKESRERVRTALKNSGFVIPPKHITVNLAPADIRKAGTLFDLPIAITLLAALGVIPSEKLNDLLIVGELSLDGRINRVNGILPIICTAKTEGIKVAFVPEENAAEGAVVDGIDVYGISHISELIEYFLDVRMLKPTVVDTEALFSKGVEQVAVDFADISGHHFVKRAIEIAASGQHNILLQGEPGTGKTLMAKGIPGILPDLSFEECLEISKIYSVAGLLNANQVLVTTRPFRSPHHSISAAALIGGGRIPRPGEMSLAEHGILFLDELPEFNRSTIEALRQPLEDGYVNVSRVQAAYTYPAIFTLVASMNNCPCGYYPDRQRCKCTPMMIDKYKGRISQPILDRIDICVDVARVDYEALQEKNAEETSAEIRKRVMKTRNIQLERYKEEGIFFNSQLNVRQIDKYCRLGKEEVELMKEAYTNYNLSTRAYHRILKCARTIADMEAVQEIKATHLMEALCYRNAERMR